MTRSTAIRAPRVVVHVPWDLLRDIGRVAGAAGDGLLVGLVAGYVALTALAGPAAYLGLPWPIAILVTGAFVAVVALLGAAAGLVVQRVASAIERRMADGSAARAHPRVVRFVRVPVRPLVVLPIPVGAAFGALLWIVLVGKDVGPFGMLIPNLFAPFVYVIGVVGSLIGLIRALALPVPDRPVGPVRRALVGVGLIATVLVTVGATAIAVDPGTTSGLVRHDPVFDGVAVTPAGLTDPGAAGPFEVERFSYGSGRDSRRTAFGTDAAIVTPTVDASAVLPRLGAGRDEIRSWFWGFGPEALPIDGLVWMPRGDGPFPLVLVVHGNHAMGDFSEDGYGYLATHLASRGFIAVSVDEDFLNGSWAGEWHGGEQLVRAWLLLLHLDQWRSWNATPTNLVFGKVDLERIALIGHSRGGEAASIAAAQAVLDEPPRSPMAPWPTGLSVDAVVSIAPSDGQYASMLELDGVDFLTLQGGHDADARAWSGIRQFARTDVGDDGFKAALWSYRANHGQFNTVWGRGDFGPYSGAILNLEPLLTPADQQDVAKTSIGAFLEASLNDQEGYRGFFRRPMVGWEWLPDDVVLVRSVTGELCRLPLGGSSQPASGPVEDGDGVVSRTVQMPLRALQLDQAMQSVLIRWEAGGDPSWGYRGLASGPCEITAASEIRFALADARSTLDGSLGPLGISIEATAGEVTVSLPLERYGALPPPLPVQLSKHEVITALAGVDVAVRTPVERVLQTYAIRLADFEAADARFSSEDLDRLTLRFDAGAPGSVYVAEVGIGPSPR